MRLWSLKLARGEFSRSRYEALIVDQTKVFRLYRA